MSLYEALLLLFAVVMSAVHLFAGKLRFLNVIPRSRLLSMAGGATVAYVVVHIFPKLYQWQQHVEGLQNPILLKIEHHIYGVCLAGLVTFYGLEIFIRKSGSNYTENEKENVFQPAFWLHLSSFAIYNALIGYVLLREELRSISNLFLYFVAMTLHFLVNDYGLREKHQARYIKIGRWLLAAAVWVGLLIGLLTTVHKALAAVFLAFLSGAVILNVFKEELPEDRESRFSAFFIGAFAYTLLLLFL